MPNPSRSLKNPWHKGLQPDRKMTNHINHTKNGMFLALYSCSVQIFWIAEIWRFTVLSISNAPNLTNAGFQGEIRTLIKFFLPDAPCLKAGELFIERRMVSILCRDGFWEFGNSRAGL
jgi:hypothetical protein